MAFQNRFEALREPDEVVDDPEGEIQHVEPQSDVMSAVGGF